MNQPLKKTYVHILCLGMVFTADSQSLHIGIYD